MWVKTLGPWGHDAKSLHRSVVKNLEDFSRDYRAGVDFAQRIRIAVQRGSASLLGTFPVCDSSLRAQSFVFILLLTLLHIEL